MNIDKIIRRLLSIPYLLLLWIVELEALPPGIDREAIRREAFKEAAATVLAYVGDVEGSSVRMIAAEILALGEPDPKPEGVGVLNV
jgi:hypothetical protein